MSLTYEPFQVNVTPEEMFETAKAKAEGRDMTRAAEKKLGAALEQVQGLCEIMPSYG